MILNATDIRLQAGEKILCENFNIEIMPGQSWAILGLNGAGKTTLLHTLAGIREANSGSVSLENQLIASWSPQQLAQHIGLLLQTHQDPFPGTVIEYVLIGRHPYLGHFSWESEQDYAIAAKALSMVGLDGFEQRDIQQLSGGEYQRMMIAMVLVQQPEFYLLDEPVNHLDWPHQHELLKTLKALSNEGSISLVMALHDVNLAARYCSHVIMMFEDSEYLTGKTSELLNKTNLERLYKTPMHELENGDQTVFVPAKTN